LLLDDGQVNTDDLLQRDMRYELVVLSACETWKADVAPGDELIGLGRGFLYAGAGAVIASLWQIDSDVTLNFMCALYGSLLSGESKAAALRRAQTALLTEPESRHPVFWAAFQLVGNADPIYQRR
jgi:CHAT domain-containing protein